MRQLYGDCTGHTVLCCCPDWPIGEHSVRPGCAATHDAQAGPCIHTPRAATLAPQSYYWRTLPHA